MALSLFHNRDWPAAQAVRVALGEIGLQPGQGYELINVDIAAGGTRTPAFLALNPQGELPVIKDTDVLGNNSGHTLVVWEGLGIVGHLFEKGNRLGQPTDVLFPGSPCEFPRTIQWASWSRHHLTPQIETLLLHGRILSGAARDATKVGPALQSFRAAIAVLEGQVPNPGGFINFDPQHPTGKYSFADTILCASLTYARGIPQTRHTFNDFPRVNAYLQSIEARPAFQAAFGPNRDPIDIPP
jgi:glutathione S-transferase